MGANKGAKIGRKMRSRQWVAGLMVGLLLGGAAALGSSAMAKKEMPPATGPVADLGKEAVVHYRMDTDAFGGSHDIWIEVDSWSWGATNTGAVGGGGGGGAGKADFSELMVTKRLDKFSPEIMLSLATGKHLKDLTLEGFASNGKNETVYFKLEMHDLLVSSYHTGGTGGGSDLPMESISFNYAKIEFDYTGPDASTGMQCDLKLGTCGH